MSPLPAVHLLTCPRRAESLAATLASWDASDWGRAHGRPTIHVDDAPEEPDRPWGDARRGERVVAAFRRMLAAAVAGGGLTAEAQSTQRNAESDPSLRSLRLRGDSRLLLLEDDVDVHPRIGAAVQGWLVARASPMATLFNPGLREVKFHADGEIAAEGPPPTAPFLPPAVRLLRDARCFAADPATFLGAQALLLHRDFARYALQHWASVTGMQSQRLAQLHEKYNGFHDAPSPLLVHRPSLVQHRDARGGSAWGARVQRAADFDPAWSPEG